MAFFKEIKKYQSQSGQIVIVAITMMAIFLMLSGSLFGYMMQNVKSGRAAVHQGQALLLAEAGIDKAIYELNKNPGFPGDSNVALGSGQFSTMVSSIAPNEKRITSTGYVPDSINPQMVKTVKATVYINTTSASFQFGVQVGNGGLTMANGSQVNGNVFSNGSVVGSGVITGSAIVATGAAAVADQEWIATDSDFSFGDGNARKDAAQSFVPSLTESLTKVSVYLRKIGTPGDITVKIVADNSDEPSKTVLASGTISAALITGNYGFTDVNLDSAPSLNGSTRYWIILSAPAVSAANYYEWAVDTSGNYLNGTGNYCAQWDKNPNPVWKDAPGDFNFRVFLGGIPTSLSGVTVNEDARAPQMNGCIVAGDASFQGLDTDCAVGGTKYPGQAAPAPQAMPISDAQIAAWEAAAQSGGTMPGTTISGNGNKLGPVKIDGDLVMENNAQLDLTGPVWVNGNIILNNGCIVQVDSTLGNASTVFIADTPSSPSSGGQINTGNNSIMQGNGFPNSFLMAISGHVGSVAIAIAVTNNMAGTIFYASKGVIDLSNNAGANQLTGYAIHLQNNAIINYLSGLQDIQFLQGPGGSWEYKRGSYVIVQ